MGWREDDEKAYTTYDDIVGRSMRRGTRKAIKALTLGLLGRVHANWGRRASAMSAKWTKAENITSSLS